jgi:hypothetical protein
MKFTFLLFIAVLSFIQNNGDCAGKSGPRPAPTPVKFDRLPENIKPETKVRKETRDKDGRVTSFEITTVEKMLTELNARYKKDILVDGQDREIKFFRPLCRGASRGAEGDVEDRLEYDRRRQDLEKKYTVIVLQCDPQQAM